MRRALVVIVALVTIAGTGCSDDDGDGDAVGASTSAPSTNAPGSRTVTTNGDVSPASDYELPFDAADALLTDADVEQFGMAQSGGDVDPEDNAQSFCGEGTPADVDGFDGSGLSFGDSVSSLNLDEILWGWENESDAEEAFDLSKRDVACGTGSFDGGGVQVEFDVDEVPLGQRYGDASYAVAGTATAGPITRNVILAQVRVDNFLLQLFFSATPDTTDAPDARKLVSLATEKLQAAAG
jgi:hypothetical protein